MKTNTKKQITIKTQLNQKFGVGVWGVLSEAEATVAPLPLGGVARPLYQLILYLSLNVYCYDLNIDFIII